jgi:phage terminase small subunit
VLYPGLNIKESAFVRCLLADPNWNQKNALIKAGYSAKTAAAGANQLMGKPHIQAALRRAMKARAMRLEAKADDVVRELMRIAYADPRDYMTWNGTTLVLRDSNELTDDEARAIKGVSKRGSVTGLDMHDKITALHLLAKHLGVIQPTKVKISQDGIEVAGSETIQIYLPDNGRQVALPEATSPGITRVLDAPPPQKTSSALNGRLSIETGIEEDPLSGSGDGTDSVKVGTR